MNKAKQNNRSRGISQNFIREVSQKLTILSSLSKESGFEIPNELEETLKEISMSSSKRTNQIESSESSIISNGPDDSFIELPPPSDSSPMNSSMESASIKQLKNNNNMLCKAVKEKLQEFRCLNKQSRNNGAKATIELKNYQNELRDMKSSVIDIIDEANNTKEQIIKMKEKLEVEMREKLENETKERLEEIKDVDSVKYEEYDMSLYKVGTQDSSNILIDQIKELHQEIFKIQNRVEKSEQDLKSKESENKELKKIIEKLNDSFERIDSVQEEPPSSCSNCILF